VPWKLDSEIVALDHLSAGRLTVGLGAGAVWMGYQAFPDEVTDSRERAEWMDDDLAILDILARREQADYTGKHRSIRLTRLDTVHYPPPSVQRPRVPLWLVGAWPRQKSMRRVLGCDGWLAAGIDAQGHVAWPTPADVQAGAAYLAANAAPGKSYDVIVEGNTLDQSPAQRRDTIAPMLAAGATWWFETLWGLPEERWEERIRLGPPVFAIM
jgi:alkanesulfonate monooxygenase SsuD/methylene tetrahydromethanopterin reductase-like flavin-dependent oxidoreductase (luciferase family)